MKKYIVLLLLMPVIFRANAQEREIIEAVSGEDLNKRVKQHMQYLFPEFSDGFVYLKGMRSAGKLNYNMLVGEMQFIDNENQVLALNTDDVQMVNIDNRKFYPFNKMEFVEELLVAGNLQLQIRRKGNVASHSKKGAYGMSSSTSAITSYNSIQGADRTHNLSVIENVMISLNKFYYLVIDNKRFLIKNQKTFTKQFSQHKTQIEAFVNDQNISFDNEDDLITLVKYCNTLN